MNDPMSSDSYMHNVDTGSALIHSSGVGVRCGDRQEYLPLETCSEHVH